MLRDLPIRIARRGLREARDAALHLPAQVLGAITHVVTKQPIVALTFDDGPHPEYTPRLLQILARHGARATFFVVGESAGRNPELLRHMAESGHAIGNHSWDHPSFPAVSSSERRRQLAACEAMIDRYSQKLFRPPYANQDLASCLDVARLGYRVIMYNVTGTDWRGDDARTVFERLARALRPGNIMLLHDALFVSEDERFRSREATLSAVELLLERYAGSYRFVTVPELLRNGRPKKEWWYQPGDASYLAALRRTHD